MMNLEEAFARTEDRRKRWVRLGVDQRWQKNEVPDAQSVASYAAMAKVRR